MRKILVIDDHPDFRDVTSWQLEALGFVAISAGSGPEGVKKAIEEKPHLILMDIIMPGMDGREATRKIRSHPETKDIPILAMTGLFSEADLRVCIEAGCNDYFMKPFTFQELQEKIDQIFPDSNTNTH